MDGFETPSNIDLRYAEKKVVFTISDCCTDKKYSFWNLNREQAERFIKRLQHFEKLEWRQWVGMDRAHGLTVENPTSESFAMIDNQNTCENKLTEKYYFHFRIEGDGLFRVFGYQKAHYFCITHIDASGRVHH